MNTTVNGIPLDQYTQAVEVARYFRDHSHFCRIHEAYLFGSTARGKATRSSDLDIIICVDEAVSREWFRLVGSDIADITDMYVDGSEERRKIALDILGISEHEFNEAVDWPVNKIDIFLFPPDWQEWLDELQKLGRHHDRNFMSNIHADAVRLELTD